MAKQELLLSSSSALLHFFLNTILIFLPITEKQLKIRKRYSQKANIGRFNFKCWVYTSEQ